MARHGMNAPKASSCGRLFDAVAAAVGLARERAKFEGQGACQLEAAVDPDVLREEEDDLAYPFAIPNLDGHGLPYIEPLAMWQAVRGDLILKTPVPVIAARFHKGLAKAICAMVCKLSGGLPDCAVARRRVALSGGCFQNKVLLEETLRRLSNQGFEVMTHKFVPANDGGLALGQAAIAAARTIQTKEI